MKTKVYGYMRSFNGNITLNSQFQYCGPQEDGMIRA